MFRPKLTGSINVEVFKTFYWDKIELIEFCKLNGLPSKGAKLELSQRIEYFLSTGRVDVSAKKIKRLGKWDSDQIITRSTPVINYKNDAKTKLFFVKNIGSNFHFNSYLRNFAKTTNMDGSITYGDLIEGWLAAEVYKKSLQQKSPIEKQFQFNIFQREFYTAERGKTRKQMIDAWKFVRSMPGEATYLHYLKLIKNKE